MKEEPREMDKQFKISRREVLNAYKDVKENKGAPGCDGVTFDEFEKDLSRNLYKIWNRMSSGSYFPNSVREVLIPKKNGTMRRLGIPTVADRVAQKVVLNKLEIVLEPLFDNDSYGYRPGKSATDAVGMARQRCWDYDYVIELDIKGLFDNIDHELLMKAVEKHIHEKWILLYIRRWLTAPFVDEAGNLEPRTSGTPQGGVISPILANLFMHYAFDVWMKIHFPEAPYERYADDGLVHCRSREEAERIKAALADRFAQCKLEMNEEKTRIAYCKDGRRTRSDEPITSFDFLGYTFTGAHIKCRDGKFRYCFIVKVSASAAKRFRDKIKDAKVHLKSGLALEDLAQLLNPMIRGWTNYFGKFCPSAMHYTLYCVECRIVRWAMRKYRNLRRHYRRAFRWLKSVRERNPKLFAHWALLY